MRYSTATLKKIEAVLQTAGYAVRYERGNFQSGYCLVSQKRVVVVNKFFDTEARIQALLEVMNNLYTQPDTLDSEAAAAFSIWLKDNNKA